MNNQKLLSATGVKSSDDGTGNMRLTVYGSNLSPLPANSTVTALVLVAEKVQYVKTWQVLARRLCTWIRNSVTGENLLECVLTWADSCETDIETCSQHHSNKCLDCRCVRLGHRIVAWLSAAFRMMALREATMSQSTLLAREKQLWGMPQHPSQHSSILSVSPTLFQTLSLLLAVGWSLSWVSIALRCLTAIQEAHVENNHAQVSLHSSTSLCMMR